MKKIFAITICLTLFGLGNLYSQTVNDVPIKEIDVDYIQIVGQSKAFSNKLVIEIDFGQENKFFSSKDTQVKDENGKRLEFNSMIDALNFFSANDYNFINAYTITLGNQNVYHYILKKRKE
jgi:hypothetical protein